jgi:hypothetical protein
MRSLLIIRRGWLRVLGVDGLTLEAQVGEHDGRRVITALIVRSDAITAGTLRNAPIGWLESVINTPGVAERMEWLNAGDVISVHHEVEVTDSAVATDSMTLTVAPSGTFPGAAPATIFGESVAVGAGTASVSATAFDATVKTESFTPDATVPKLRRPDGRDPDGFYRQVAQAYNAAVATTEKPAKLIAEQAEVPVPTVHRWIAEARRRNFLPRARRGKAG